MVQAFISRLSRVRENTHETILAALETGGADSEHLIEQKLETVLKRIQAAFQNVRVEMENAEQATFSDFQPVEEAELLSSPVFQSALAAITDKQWEQINFYWPQPYVPQGVNLAQCDVIEIAIAAVDVAVSACISRLDSVVSTVRASYLAHYRAYFSRMDILCREWLSQQREKAEGQLTAYNQNYAGLFPQAQQILRTCEGLENTAETTN